MKYVQQPFGPEAVHLYDLGVYHTSGWKSVWKIRLHIFFHYYYQDLYSQEPSIHSQTRKMSILCHIFFHVSAYLEVLHLVLAQVKIDNELSDPIEVTKGLRQGCSLSPILFNICGKNPWTMGRRAAKELECQSKKISACFLLTMLMIRL